MGAVMSYFLNVLIGIDQLANAVTGGSPDETLSARAWRAESNGKMLGMAFRPLIDILFCMVERNHCEKAFIAELQKMQLPKDYSA